MTYFPFYENIDGKNFLIVGGGSVAAEKASRLLPFTKRITVVAKDAGAVRELTGDRLRISEREFCEEDLGGADFVICATNDADLNRRVAQLCRDRKIPVNVVDDPRLCTFVFPAILKRGDLVVAVSTSGASPTYAQKLKAQIEALLPEDVEELLSAMRSERERIQAEVSDPEERKAQYRECLARLLAEGKQSGDGADE